MIIESVLSLDEAIVKELEPWKKAIDKIGRKYVGNTTVLIDQSKCKQVECNAGNLVTDAMVETVSNEIC